VSPSGAAACFIHKKMLPRDHSFSFAAATAKENAAAGSCANIRKKRPTNRGCIYFSPLRTLCVR
jgi:hypothetical protein